MFDYSALILGVAPMQAIALLIIALFILILLPKLIGLRSIPNNRVGVIERIWSSKGSVREGQIIALNGEAGFQAELLRGGLHLFYWPWQYRIHKVSLVTIPENKIGYVYARDGAPLDPSQTLARVVESNHFQDAREFLAGGPAPGQRGRQRAILREGVYAINLALFVVVTENRMFYLNFGGKDELDRLLSWQKDLTEIGGFRPVVLGGPIRMLDPLSGDECIGDSIGIVTVQDGPSLDPGEIIAPAVGAEQGDPNYHNNYQDPEAFLRAGGRRGRQYNPVTDGTYYINRWFATVDTMPKLVVPIGYVGVVVSYYGPPGKDTSGESFRHGERVAMGERGVWDTPLGPGKYAFNTYAGQIVMVPTTNFVLHWITGRTEAHRYDEGLRSIDIVTKDAYEPLLPLSLVVHIDYMRAPSVIQRFGDVKRLITQTLDPMLSAYFRDVAHKWTMLELLHQRDQIQAEAREALKERFGDFDIECVDVLIGKPDTAEAGGKIEVLLEQLRTRQLSTEQLETFEKQRVAAEELRKLNEAQALAARQTELTGSQVQIRIAENQGEADLARARKQAQQVVVVSEGELERSRRQAEQVVVTAKAESEQRILAGRGEGQRVMQVGLSEAMVLTRKIGSYGDPRLYALALAAEYLANSNQPLVPERLFVAGENGNGKAAAPTGGLLGLLISLLVAEKSGFAMQSPDESPEMKEMAHKIVQQAMENMAKPAVVKSA